MVVVILLTGMSGAGRSTALVELARRGFEAVDTDEGDWIEVIDGEPLWKVEPMDALLARPRAVPLFVQGAVADQEAWYPRFAAVVLMTALLEVLLERIRTRTSNPFGRTAAERAQVPADHAAVEPLLRASASHVIDTSGSVASVVEALVSAGAAAGAERHP